MKKMIILGVLTISLFARNYKKEFDAILKSDFNNRTPSVSIAVIQNGKIIYKNAFGMANLELKVPATTQSVYRIGSLSKQFTGACLAMLIQDKMISTFDKLIQYFPEFPADVYGRITIEHMLYHTSGIRDSETMYPLLGIAFSQWYTHDMLIEMLKRQNGLSFEPGSRYEYSNSAYTLLALIVEKVSGQKFNVFVENNIFKPLGMDHSKIQISDKTFISNRAAGYKPWEENYINWMTNNQLVGHDAVYSSTEDLFIWQQALEKGRIGKYSLEVMKNPGKFNDGTKGNYGYGLVIGKYRGLDYYGHDGWYVGYKAFFMALPEKNFSIIILSNNGDLYVRKYAMKLLETYFYSYNFWKKNLEKISNQTPEKYLNKSKFVRKSIGGFKNVESLKKEYFQSIDCEDEFLTVDELKKIKVLKTGNNSEFFEYTSYGSQHHYVAFEEIEISENFKTQILGQYFSSELKKSGKIFWNGEKLVLKIGFAEYKLIQVFPDEFANEECLIQIQKDESGDVIGFEFSTYGVRGISFKKE
ncbi:MAG: beta-lactamase family protein [Candidatus Marinimicrobia bacterium]|nr:beta-lactamase family protein [Candidatus Neomarinimicrobiota bacterium]